jgi:hypothetical protein
MRSRRIPIPLDATRVSQGIRLQTNANSATSAVIQSDRDPSTSQEARASCCAQDDTIEREIRIMLIFEQLVSRGLMVFDPNRKVLTFNLSALARFPAIRQQRIDEFKWMIGDWAFENHVRATPTTPSYTDTYYYTYELADNGTRFTVSGHGAKARPYLTFDPFSNRWMMTFTEGLFGVLQSNGWEGDTIVFSGPLTMLGIDCELRQTITKKSPDEFHILNEEKLPDGSWRETDEFFCRRKQP